MAVLQLVDGGKIYTSFLKYQIASWVKGGQERSTTRNEDHHAAEVVVTVYLLFKSDLHCMKQICDKLEESKDLFLCHTIPAGLWAGDCYPGYF